jgi:hypothetical protein
MRVVLASGRQQAVQRLRAPDGCGHRYESRSLKPRSSTYKCADYQAA